MPAETRELTDTVVAITGASAGIGAAAARLLLESGARVAVQARRKDRLDGLVSEFGADRVLAVTGDVRDPAAATSLVSAAIDAFGKLDSIVINAGIGMYGGVLDRSDEDLQTMMRTNIEGTVWAARAAVGAFRKAGAGDIVIVASVAGLRGGEDEAVYAATKFAQVGFAGALDREVRTDGIRVTAICPAGVETEFAIGAGRTEGDPSLADYLRPEDVAHAIVTVLEQPRRVRTTQWQLWSMGQGS
ncbi:SDR family oxidoreductase [Jatrophihabitans lederbergiae]|uniref:SDR family NAD(P)-dependent oxidoreductase n=1 Tax=Jatrophihabitans lederbergiae TaxID=3075547 RepID=A0ABU2JFS3_9ACTN|nr:SDR family NAD(P)-dependent oxidoreductase [Jatrophihabitans sp. DSM 44399]MDT0263851.1 SDR family NAD(P)-dependent oxidoreductase [Jatrophihabitans sp. DSM 44399]